jgi:ABC-2 type transport system permease protein
MFVSSALGGNWLSLGMVGKTFAATGHITPTAWAMDGFQNIILRGLGVQSIPQPAGVLLSDTGAFFGIAV